MYVWERYTESGPRGKDCRKPFYILKKSYIKDLYCCVQKSLCRKTDEHKNTNDFFVIFV